MAARRRRPATGAGARDTLTLLALALCAPGVGGGALEWYSAMVGIEYVDPLSNQTVRSMSESGRFGDSSPREDKQGLVVGVPRADGNKEGCAPDTRFVAPGGLGAAPWVALVARGVCTFKDKVLAAARRNASAVVVYNQEHYGNATEPMSHAGEQAGRGAALRGRGEPAGFPGGVERKCVPPLARSFPLGVRGRCVRRPGSDLGRGVAKDLRRRKILPIARGLQIPDRRGRLRSLHRLAKLAEWCLCGSGGRSFPRRTPGSRRLLTSLKRWLAGSLVSSL